jgi:hypothetical protein
VGGVTASKLDIRREAKVFANHHLVTRSDRSGERLVVSIAKAQDNAAIIASNILTLEGEPSEVAKATTSKSVFLLSDLKTCTVESVTSHLHQVVMRDWSVGICPLWGLNSSKLLRIDFVFCVDKHNSS